ncbi:MAG: ABC transporter ATP-binding protein [Burkholderiales bacterium]
MRIAVRDLTKRFGPLEVVSRASFSIGEGELFTLLGPSGCGKTTLLRLIAGFYAPDEGEVRFDDRRVNDVPPHERGIGMVFQNYALWPHMTVFDNVGYGLKLRKLGRAEVAQRVEGVLDKVRLAGLGNRYPGQLSGGQQQRVALARALVLNPQILLLDEPLSNLDAKIRIQVRAEIRKLQKELGITTVYVTHDQEEALTLSDRIAVFNQGRVFQVGAPKDLYERPANRFVADFIGINNLIEGTVRSVDAARGWLTAETVLGELQALLGERLSAGDRCVICIRPENIILDKAAADGNFVSGKIAFAAYLGNTLRYDVDLGQGVTFKADIRDPWHHEQLAMGSAVGLGFPVGSTLAIPAA